MRTYDGAEVCELVGTYIYFLYQKGIIKNISDFILMMG